MTSSAMTIDGSAVPGENTFTVVNPATGEDFAEAPDCTEEQLEAAIAAAQGAFGMWRRSDDARRDVLASASKVLTANLDEVAELVTREQGKPFGQALMEIESAVAWLDYFAAVDVPVEVLQNDATARIELHRQPLGPVAAITPWNFPVALAFWKIAPALRAGNTIVVKPSPYTPLSSLKIGELLAEVIPPGVLNVISGRDPLGAKLAAHPAIRKISFTGSTATGKKVAAAASSDLKRVTLELGGNDPAIILDDADPQAVAGQIFFSAMANAGQICMAVKRVYVPRHMHDDVVEAMAAAAAFANVGDGFAEGVNTGPVSNRPQLDRVSGLVADAVGHGAKAVVGGSALERPGFFWDPTILVDVDDSMAIVAEEQFGPVVPVLAYDDLSEAVQRANDSHYGLGSSIWTSDPERGAAVARDIEAGTTWVNSHLQVTPNQPFGGVKWSGLGVENGLIGLHEFSAVHVIHAPGTQTQAEG
jgi:acyl-CoA reductase-like NAD-dependent aldehyde dehydrogenase